MEGEVPRPLTATESAVLALLLSVDFPGVDALRLQASSATVVRRCDCGCPSIAFEVPKNAPAASGLNSRLAPAEGVVGPTADGLPGEIILFVDDGRLSFLEYVYYGGAPKEWPALDRITVSAKPR